MQAIVTRDRAAGISGLSLAEMPYPHAAENDVIVEVHAASFTPDELNWPGTWTDRAGRDRTPTIPGHEVSGVVAELGYGTTGLAVGQRVFGLTDWARNGTLAEYVAVEARNLAPLSDDIDHIVAAALPMPGLTAWQGLFDHGQLGHGSQAPTVRSSERPASSRDHWGMGRPLIRVLEPSTCQSCGQPDGESSHGSWRPYTVRSISA